LADSVQTKAAGDRRTNGMCFIIVVSYISSYARLITTHKGNQSIR